MRQPLSIGSLLLPLGVVALAYFAAKGVLDVAAHDDLKWEVKAVALGIVGFSLLAALLLRYEKAKRYIPFILAILISETGFAYEIKPGYFTSANEVLTAMILLVWLTRKMLLRGPSGPQYFSRELKIFLGVAMAGVVTAYAIFEVSPLNILTVFKSYTLYLFYLFLIPDCIRSEKELRTLVLFMLALSLIPLFRGVLGGMAIENLLEERLEVTAWGALNIFVGYILPIFFIAFGLLLEEKKKWLRVLLIGYMGTIVYLLFLAQTRTAWAALAIGMGLFMVLTKRRIAAAVVTLIIVAGIMFSPAGGEVETVVRHRVVGQTFNPNSALQDRYSRWEGAWETAKAYPLTGSGWGGVLPITADGSVGDSSLPLLPLWHNCYLELISQLGFPGLLAFLLLWWKIMRTEGRSLFVSPNVNHSSFSRGLFIAVVACLIYALAEQQFFKIETASHSYFLAGLLLAARNVAGSEEGSAGDKNIS